MHQKFQDRELSCGQHDLLSAACAAMRSRVQRQSPTRSTAGLATVPRRPTHLITAALGKHDVQHDRVVGLARHLPRPSSPSVARSTAKPSASRARRTASAMLRSSSTTRRESETSPTNHDLLNARPGARTPGSHLPPGSRRPPGISRRCPRRPAARALRCVDQQNPGYHNRRTWTTDIGFRTHSPNSSAPSDPGRTPEKLVYFRLRNNPRPTGLTTSDACALYSQVESERAIWACHAQVRYSSQLPRW